MAAWIHATGNQAIAAAASLQIRSWRGFIATATNGG
jgi:hypothetical protein